MSTNEEGDRWLDAPQLSGVCSKTGDHFLHGRSHGRLEIRRDFPQGYEDEGASGELRVR
jgi:hypothetical protein